jgi:hypothetical protein
VRCSRLTATGTLAAMAIFQRGQRVRWGDGEAEVIRVLGARVVCRTPDGLERITSVESLQAHQPRALAPPRSLLSPRDGAA